MDIVVQYHQGNRLAKRQKGNRGRKKENGVSYFHLWCIINAYGFRFLQIKKKREQIPDFMFSHRMLQVIKKIKQRGNRKKAYVIPETGYFNFFQSFTFTINISIYLGVCYLITE